MDFWADHGKMAIAIILGIISVGTLVYLQGKLVQRLEGSIRGILKDVKRMNEDHDAKIAKNCKSIMRVANELHELKESKLLTRPEHDGLTINCRKEVSRQVGSEIKLVNSDMKSISETMADMRSDMKEDRIVRQEQAKQLTEHVVILHGFKESLAELRADR